MADTRQILYIKFWCRWYAFRLYVQDAWHELVNGSNWRKLWKLLYRRFIGRTNTSASGR